MKLEGKDAVVSIGVTSQTISNGNLAQQSCESELSTQVTEKQTISEEICHQKTISNGDKSQPFQEIGTQTESQLECMNLNKEKVTNINGNGFTDSASSGKTTGWRAVPSEDNGSNIFNGQEKEMQNNANKCINGNSLDERCTKNIQGNNSEGCNRSTRSRSYADAIKSAQNSDIITTRRRPDSELSRKVPASNEYTESLVNDRSHDNSNSCSKSPFSKKQSKLPHGNVNGNIGGREYKKSISKKAGYQIIPRFENNRNNLSKKTSYKKSKKNPSESAVKPLDSAEVLSNTCEKLIKHVVSNGNPDKIHEQVDPKCHGAIPKVRNRNKVKQKNPLENSMPLINELKETFQDNFVEKSDFQTLKNGNTETAVPSADHFIDAAVEHGNSFQQELTDLNVQDTTVNDEVNSISCTGKSVIKSKNNEVDNVLYSYPLNRYGYRRWSEACSKDDSVIGACGYDPHFSRDGPSSYDSDIGACGYDPHFSRDGPSSYDSDIGACGYDQHFSRDGPSSYDSDIGACGYDPHFSRDGTSSFVRDSVNSSCWNDADYFDRYEEDSSMKNTTVARVSKSCQSLNPLTLEYVPASMKNHCDNSDVSNLAELCDEFMQLHDQADLSSQTASQSQLSNQVESDAPLHTSVDSLPVVDDLEEYLNYMFLLHSNLSGTLIGKKGKFLNHIYSKATVKITVSRGDPNSDMNVVTILGRDSQVQIALEIIKNRFKYVPSVSFEQINAPAPVSSERLKTKLSVNADYDVILTSTVLPNHFFIQLPTMSSYHQLPSMYKAMSFHYDNKPAPIVVKLEVGNIVAAPFNNCGSLLWLRALVTTIFPGDKCEVRFLDMGGYGDYERRELRKMHPTFMQFPFQAVECFLANVSTPENGWTEESIVIFRSLTQNQILKAVVAYAEDDTPYLFLYRYEPYGHSRQLAPEWFVLVQQFLDSVSTSLVDVCSSESTLTVILIYNHPVHLYVNDKATSLMNLHEKSAC